jgi:hypothetical protein
MGPFDTSTSSVQASSGQDAVSEDGKIVCFISTRRGTTLSRVIFLGRWLLGGQN